MSSSTYVYAYVAFAAVYLVSAIAFVVNALRVSTALSRNRTAVERPRLGEATPPTSSSVARTERLLSYTQLATLLPLAYIVGSAFLGSRILKGAGPRAINILWLAFTIVACLASVFLAARGVHESRALSRAAFVTDESRRPADFYQRVGVRLGLSAALLTLVAVFMLLNLFSVLGDLDSVLNAQYLL